MITKAKREAVAKRLAEIEAANDGRLTPDAVVADARRKDSPLHDLFEWDVRKAAHAHWLDRAREIIASVVVKITTDTKVVKSVAYVRDPDCGPGEQGYVSVEKLRTNEDRAREALANEFSRVADLLRRARELAAALDMSDDVERLVTGVVDLRRRVLDAPTARM